MPSSLDGLNYNNVFRPDMRNVPDYNQDYQQGFNAVQQVFDTAYKNRLREQQLAQGQQRMQLDALLAPYQVDAQKQQALIRQNQVAQLPTANAINAENLKQEQYNTQILGRDINGLPLLTAPGGITGSAPLPTDSSPANPGALMGDGFTAKATGYHPVSPDSPEYKMEGGILDAQGNKIFTLDAFRRGEVPYVTAAIDRNSPLFGQTAFSPTLGAPIKFSDTGSAFKGKGNSRVDIARDTNAGANSDENNGPIQFTLGNPSQPARSQPGQPIVSPELTGPSIPTSPRQLASVNNGVPIAQTRMATGYLNNAGEFQELYGKERPPQGYTMGRFPVPLSREIKNEDGEIIGNEVGGKFRPLRANGFSGDPDEKVKNALSAAGIQPSTFVQDGRFNRLAAQDELAKAKAKLPTAVVDLGGLDDTQKFQASALTAEIFGKRNGNQADKVNMVAELIRQGKDPVDIRAELSPSSLTARYSGQYKNDPAVVIYGTVATNFSGMRKIAELPEKDRTGPDDLSFLFQYTNADNPRSAVTEAAFNEAGKTGSLPTRIQNIYNGIVSGNRLTQTQVEQFTRAIEHKLSGVREGYLTARDRYKGLAQATSANGEAVIGPDFNPMEGRENTGTAKDAAKVPSSAPIAKPTSKAEYDALPKGARYLAQDGVTVKIKS